MPSPPSSVNWSGKKKVDEPVFSFYLGEQSGQDGELLIGGVDKDKYTGDLQWVPLIAQDYWRVELTSVQYKGQPLFSEKQKAIIDSGTSILAGPTEAVDKLASAIGAWKVLGKYVMSCNTEIEDITFELGGKKFPLSGKDLLMPVFMHFCLVSIIPMDIPAPNGPLWIMGDTFMRRYYSVFDYGQKRVGLAEAKPAAAAVTEVEESIIV